MALSPWAGGGEEAGNDQLPYIPSTIFLIKKPKGTGMFCLRVLASFTTLIQKNERVLTKIRKKMSEFRIIKNRGLSFLTDRSGSNAQSYNTATPSDLAI